VYSTSCIFTGSRTEWLSCVWTPQGGTRWQ
jgi:hypothetical protein